LPILAGLVVSAARLADRLRVANAESLIAAEASSAFPFETAGAWLALARARRILGDAAAGDAAAAKAAVIAHAHKYHEISHRLEQRLPRVPIPLADVGMGVVRSLESWSDDPAREISLSSASMD
jgi:hypothetical protein